MSCARGNIQAISSIAGKRRKKKFCGSRRAGAAFFSKKNAFLNFYSFPRATIPADEPQDG
jgi:hypothetical protein